MVVAAGVTWKLVSPVTAPTPWSMLSEVAPVTVHMSVELAPGAMDGALAVKLVMVGAGAGASTLTAATAVRVGSAWLAPTTWNRPGAFGAVYRPMLVMVPPAGEPSWMLQVTAVSGRPVSSPLNWTVACGSIWAMPGLMPKLAEAEGGPESIWTTTSPPGTVR